jgi:hypothetical protein
VCGGREFAALDAAAVARIIAEEGGVEEETTYDGRRVRWTQDAKEALRAIDDRYQRRRAKARIEKAAHGRRTDVITLDLAKRFIEEETGVLYQASADHQAARGERTATEADGNGNGHGGNGGNGNGHANADGHANGDGLGSGNGQRHDGDSPAVSADDVELRLVARDGKNVPLLSSRAWSSDAIERLLRVPAGFMRDRTQQRVEAVAAERARGDVDLALVEEGIELGKRMMEEMLGQYGGDLAAAAQAAAPAGVPASQVPPMAPAVELAATAAAGTGSCPFSRIAAAGQHDTLRALFPLDEVSVVSELERKRRELGGEAKG